MLRPCSFACTLQCMRIMAWRWKRRLAPQHIHCSQFAWHHGALRTMPPCAPWRLALCTACGLLRVRCAPPCAARFAHHGTWPCSALLFALFAAWRFAQPCDSPCIAAVHGTVHPVHLHHGTVHRLAPCIVHWHRRIAPCTAWPPTPWAVHCMALHCMAPCALYGPLFTAWHPAPCSLVCSCTPCHFARHGPPCALHGILHLAHHAVTLHRVHSPCNNAAFAAPLAHSQTTRCGSPGPVPR